MAEKHGSFWNRFKNGLIFWLLWLVSTGIAATVRFKVVGWEKLEKIVADGKGGLILPWHGVTMLPIYYCRNMGFYSIVSLSKDGELQNRILVSRGFKTIRGSSGRNGARALLESVRCLKDGNVMALTPDGLKPYGKIVQPGTIYLAQRSGCPVLPVGVACKPCKRLASWDELMIPALFSRAVIAFGDPLYIGEDESETDAALRIGKAINDAERSANEILG